MVCNTVALALQLVLLRKPFIQSCYTLVLRVLLLIVHIELQDVGQAMILEAMYNGEFYPCETVVPTSPEYRKAIIACEKLMEQLFQRLSKEDYELVQELRAQTAIAQCEESESHFKYGFSAGLIVQQEAHEQVQQKKEK